jgi:hypothetical protein
MKKLSIVLMALFIVLGGVGTVAAIPVTFTDSFDWNVKTDDTGRTWQRIGKRAYTFQFDDFFLPEDAVVTSIDLALVHKGNKGKKGKEVWKLDFDGTRFRLERSRGEWVEQHFSLDPSLLSEGSNPLLFSLREFTSGKDRIKLDEAVITIDYVSVPEPATVLLLASGLIALGWWERKRLRRKP